MYLIIFILLKLVLLSTQQTQYVIPTSSYLSFTFQAGHTDVSFTVRKQSLFGTVFSYLMDTQNFNLYSQRLPGWTFIVGNKESKYGSFYSDSYSTSNNRTSGGVVLVVENRATLNSATITVEMNAYSPVPPPPPPPVPVEPLPTPFPPGPQYDVNIRFNTHEVFTFYPGFTNLNFTVQKIST